MGVGDRAVVVDENNERVSSLNPRAIRRTCELRERELETRKKRNRARRRGERSQKSWYNGQWMRSTRLNPL